MCRGNFKSEFVREGSKKNVTDVETNSHTSCYVYSLTLCKCSSASVNSVAYTLA